MEYTTYEEAIKILRPIVFESDNESLALMEAVEALEKQIPKHPKIDRITYTNGSGYFDELNCPNCGNYLIQRDDFGEYFAGSQNNYCEECGQAIDWSEE